ncbi:hypothetical protein [Erythrobacter sp.]|uniref:DUF1281 family ferredoxin-like fold protein n=1 Tax=Erythrobacter sp. TaxID=1042 RepID=UPI0025FCD5B7|nr:hypothetical protein [Erythrobacter sp.]
MVTIEEETDKSIRSTSRRDLILDFDAVIPMPEDQKVAGGAHWAVENWGTKWSGFDVEIKDIDAETLWFQFTTAWDFPTPAFVAIAAEFPLLTFSGTAFEENHEFELAGDFNGPRPWAPARLSFR